MDGNGGKGLLFTKMSPGFDNWRQEAQCSSTHSKSMQPCRSATEPRIEPEKKNGGMTTLFVGGKRVEGLQRENEKGNLGVAEVDKSSTSNNMKEAAHSFKFVLIEHIRDVLKPYWERGNLSKDAYKIILKKSMDKIIGSIVESKFPKTKSDQQKYLSASKSKIFELIQNASILKCVPRLASRASRHRSDLHRVSSNMDLAEHQISMKFSSKQRTQ